MTITAIRSVCSVVVRVSDEVENKGKDEDGGIKVSLGTEAAAAGPIVAFKTLDVRY
jgi:hypothetical protein